MSIPILGIIFGNNLYTLCWLYQIYKDMGIGNRDEVRVQVWKSEEKGIQRYNVEEYILRISQTRMKIGVGM